MQIFGFALYSYLLIMKSFEVRGMATKDIRVIYNKLDEMAYEEFDICDILGDRELPDFRENWLRLYRELWQIKYAVKYPEWRDELRKSWRKRSFQKVYKYTKSMGLASAVAGDMEIMYDGLVLNYEDPWFIEMLETYEQGKIPVGSID